MADAKELEAEVTQLAYSIIFMSVAKEQIRQIIAENNISSVSDVYSLLKDSFKDILQELTEAELDAALGYQKNQKGDLRPITKETDILQRISRASMGYSRLMSPETAIMSLSQS